MALRDRESRFGQKRMNLTHEETNGDVTVGTERVKMLLLCRCWKISLRFTALTYTDPQILTWFSAFLCPFCFIFPITLVFDYVHPPSSRRPRRLLPPIPASTCCWIILSVLLRITCLCILSAYWVILRTFQWSTRNTTTICCSSRSLRGRRRCCLNAASASFEQTTS